MDGNNALQALETRRFQVFYPEDNGREGLYIDVAALSIACFGNQAWALRLPSALFGILTVAGVALVGAELFGASAGLLAAFFLATSFWHMLLSREAFRAVAAPCFLTWTVYLLLAARRRPALLAAAGIVYGLGFYTYLAYRATPLLLILFLRREGWKRAALFATVAAVVAAPLAVYFAGHPGTFFSRTSQIAVWNSRPPAAAAAEALRNTWRTARMFFTHGDYNWRHNYPWRAEVYWPVAGFLVLGALARRKGKAIVLAWLAVAALPVALSGEDIPHALRALLMLPAAMLLAALGAETAWGFLVRRLPPRLSFALAALLLAGLAYEPVPLLLQPLGARPRHAPRLRHCRRPHRRANSQPAARGRKICGGPAGSRHGSPARDVSHRQLHRPPAIRRAYPLPRRCRLRGRRRTPPRRACLLPPALEYKSAAQ